jgi:predicted  nucleic acid-binding Zn-ribbon protein
VAAQQKRIDAHQQEREAIHEQIMEQRKQADELEGQTKDAEAKIEKLRVALNQAKTNKEYASLLTQINTIRADNANIDDAEMKVLENIDALKAKIEEIDGLLEEETKRLEDVKSTSQDEISRLEKVIADLEAKRATAAEGVAPEVLNTFDKMAEKYDGEAVAEVQINGRRPPYSYTCGGCFMALNAEHANALRTRDEVRQCDNCLRLLVMPKDDPGVE